MKLTSTFPERLSEATKGMSTSQIADKLGISRQSVSAYFCGTRKPKRLAIASMAQILNVNPAWLMGYDVPRDLVRENNTPNAPSFPLTDHEKDLILAYRKNPAMQTAVDKLLGIDASGAGGDVLQDMAAQLSITLPRSNSTIKQK